jgi:hypothetical protein
MKEDANFKVKSDTRTIHCRKIIEVAVVETTCGYTVSTCWAPFLDTYFTGRSGPKSKRVMAAKW